MTNDAAQSSIQVYEIYIKAPPERIWHAITSPECTARFGYRGSVEYELRPGGAFRAHAPPQMIAMGLPDVVVDGEVIEADPPRKLVQTYRFLFSAENKAEGFTRLSYEIAPTQSGFSRLTVTHELARAPIMAAAVSSRFSEQGSGGWNWVISDLKTLLETGTALSA